MPDLAILTFRHANGAERAYADAIRSARGAPWLREVVFVEAHHRSRIVVRGTFAGHYLDVDDVGDAIGRDTLEGALAGGLVGIALGPVGLATGLVGGGIIGGAAESRRVVPPSGELFDEIRAAVGDGASAIVHYAPAADVDAAIAAFGDRCERVERHTPTPEEARALEEAVRNAPPAATA
jgi:hypothetical protein